MPQYQYLDEQGDPVLFCPKCKADWTKPDGINLELCFDSTSPSVVSHHTRLDNDGNLIDTDDHAVENGYHSCTRCGEQLLNMEGVEEYDTDEDEEECSHQAATGNDEDDDTVNAAVFMETGFSVTVKKNATDEEIRQACHARLYELLGEGNFHPEFNWEIDD